MLSAVLVHAFEEHLERNVLIAVFVPAVVYMADAVGTQTETVLIRAMATGVTARAIARREIASGIAIGVLVGLVFFVFALTAWGDSSVATAVALALVASCSIASLVALALPAVLRYFGQDPAFGAGPLATVVQDLLSVAVYLAIASAMAA
jgi:magnesium transporter